MELSLSDDLFDPNVIHIRYGKNVVGKLIKRPEISGYPYECYLKAARTRWKTKDAAMQYIMEVLYEVQG